MPITEYVGHSTWLHRAYQQNFYGYRLGSYGGNFVNFNQSISELEVEFSFYKDFVLTQDLSKGILLSNIDNQLTSVPCSVISAKLNNGEIKFTNYDIRHIFLNKALIDLTQAAAIVKNILIENLRSVAADRKVLISYSGGLDSGTLAWLSHYENIDFTAVVENRFKTTWELPFDCYYSKLLKTPSDPLYHWTSPTVDHFYHPALNGTVGGFYGDIALLHHRDLYYQSQHLTANNLEHYEHYDCLPSSQLPQFRDRNAMLSSIVKLHLRPHFRQWFDNFEIVDVYRDPRLFESILRLDIDDLLIQFKTAYIQKHLINSMSRECWNFLCDYKNDYSKF